MQIIEANASRSFTLKVAKADYRGEERYRPNEDIMVHAGLKATLAPGEDAAAARMELQKMCEADVALGVQVAREEARRRLDEALNPQRSDPNPASPAPRQVPPQAPITANPQVQAPVAPAPLTAYQPAANLAAAQRICSNTSAHKVAAPSYIHSNVYDYSLERFGRPLCRPCQATQK